MASRGKLRWDLVRQAVKEDFARNTASASGRPSTAFPHVKKDGLRAPSFGKSKILRTGSGKHATAVGWSSTGRLKNIFFQFTGGEMEMNQTMFLKFAKDCQVYNEQCTSHDVGIIFAKIRSAESRKLSYQQFLDGVWHCAEKRGEHMESLERVILESGGLKVTGTIPLATRLHDERVDPLSTSGLSQASTVDNEETPHALRPLTAAAASSRWRRPMTAKSFLKAASTRDLTSRVDSSKELLGRASSAKELKEPRPSIRSLMRSGGSFRDFNSTILTASKELEKVFFTFSNYSSQMDRSAFLKFADDCGVVSALCNAHDMKNIFADVKSTPSAKAITYAQFLDALKLCAAKRQTTFEHIEKIINRWAPSITKPTENLEHRSLYPNGESTLRHVQARHVSPDPVQNWDLSSRGVKLDYVPLAPAKVFQRLMKHLDEEEPGPVNWDQAPCDPPPEPERVDVFRNGMSAF